MDLLMYITAASTANTRRACAADWDEFVACCSRHGFRPAPASQSAVETFNAEPAAHVPAGEPVAVTSHGRISGYFVSEQEFEERQRLRKLERRVCRIEELPAEIADAIEGSRMDPKYDPLNALLDE